MNAAEHCCVALMAGVWTLFCILPCSICTVFLAVIISMASSCLTICALSMVLGDLAASFILPNEPGRQWVKVGYLNMSDPTQQCPYPWQTVWSPTGASCEKKDSALCDSVNISTSGASYQKVCGRFLGYQIGSPDAFNSMRIVGLRWDIEKYYVDGVSITYGSPGNRQHVYTYAAGGTEYNSPDSCPCTGGAYPPAFVGSDYYCESGNNETTDDNTMFYNADVLWDRQLCRHEEVTCCYPTSLPWFCKTFPNPITENMEVRICLDEALDNENVAIQFFELYILALMPTVESTSMYPSTSSLTVGLGVGVPVSILVGILIVGVVIAATVLFQRHKQNEKREQVMTNELGFVRTHISSLGAESQKLYKSECDRYHFEDVLVHYDQLHMDEQPCGSGEFGIVYHATLTTKDGQKQDVAVKSAKNNYSEGVIRTFLEECSLMKSFSHPNVLGLVGMCLDSPDQVPLMVLPFMANGNLKKYLQHARSFTKTDQYPKGLSCHVLTSMCLDIARGMSYLADKRLVHRDLAARNCMVDNNLMIKVGDFGLSRDIYTTDYYKMSNFGLCPIKWMPPEMIRDGISSEKSDIWAYGVTCWEVFSIGTNPYPGVENRDILQHLDEGLRLKQTTLCPDQIFVLMTKCWLEDAQARPTFQQLVLELEVHQN